MPLIAIMQTPAISFDCRQCLSAVSGGVPSLSKSVMIYLVDMSPMPVGSEWWGAFTRKGSKTITLSKSPMPVGSEWWGAGSTPVEVFFFDYYQVAKACRQ